MTHVGAVCDAAPSHVMITGALGRELQNRGYRFTLFQSENARSLAEIERVSFHSWRGTAARKSVVPIPAVRATFGKVAAFLEVAPAALREAGVDLLLADEVHPAAGSVAESLGIPFVSFSCGIPVLDEPDVPPLFVPWRYRAGPWSRARNRLAYRLIGILGWEIEETIRLQRRRWKLPPRRTRAELDSTLAQLSQLVPEFDFPRKRLPDCFHYTGPFLRERREDTPFPFEKLTELPMVFASFGTLNEGERGVWQTVIDACEGEPVQLVLALGGRTRTGGGLRPGANTTIASYVPQQALLRRASLVICHGGLNTTLESLSEGLPIVVIPFRDDQLGVSARVLYHGLGEVHAPERLRPDALRMSVRRLLSCAETHGKAAKVGAVMRGSGGVRTAADIIEQVIRTGKPVLRIPAPASLPGVV